MNETYFHKSSHYQILPVNPSSASELIRANKRTDRQSDRRTWRL